MEGFEVFGAYFVFGMLVAAISSRALGATIIYSIGLLALFPDEAMASWLAIGLVIAAAYGEFRS